jgi:uncharacterized cupin superfamily protein
MARPPNVVAASSTEMFEQTHGQKYAMKRWILGAAAGGRKLGCSLYELPPGKAAWPYHYHTANEEAIYVLEGEAMLRLPQGEVPVAAGDYIALPVGADHAHQIRNSGTGPLRFLCVSTMIEPEVAHYPDSDKVGLFTGSAPGGSQKDRTLTAFLKLGNAGSYWDGEE